MMTRKDTHITARVGRLSIYCVSSVTDLRGHLEMKNVSDDRGQRGTHGSSGNLFIKLTTELEIYRCRLWMHLPIRLCRWARRGLNIGNNLDSAGNGNYYEQRFHVEDDQKILWVIGEILYAFHKMG
ncbi:hypothetical protein Trydic_g3203 [Trypoxylus dichotomus]